MKRGALLVSISLILILSLSLVSANWFTDLFKKPQLSPSEISLTNQLFGTWSASVTWLDVMKADVNGDGLDDVIGREASNGNWWAGISDGTKFTNKLFGTWSTHVSWTNIMIADVNNDGKDDVIGKASDGNWWAGISDGTKFNNTRLASWIYKEKNKLTGDINGDGYIDKVQLDSEGSWWVSYSYSDPVGSLRPAIKIGDWSSEVIWLDVQVADVNGDGLDDVIGRVKSAGSWWAGISTSGGGGGGGGGETKEEIKYSCDGNKVMKCVATFEKTTSGSWQCIQNCNCETTTLSETCASGCSDGACIGGCVEGQHGFTFTTQGTYGIELNAAIKNGNTKINVLYGDGSFFNWVGGSNGEDSLRTGTNTITFDRDTDNYFVASWASSAEAESYLLKISSTKDSSGKNYTSIQNIVTGNTIAVDRKTGDVVIIGNVEITVGTINHYEKTVELTINSGGSFNKIYDTSGNSIKLPLQSELPKGNYIFNILDISGNLIGKYEAYHVNGQAAIDNRCQTATCTDSDNGKNYYTKGTFSGLWYGSQITNTDSCVDALDDSGDEVTSSNYLGEGYCENNQLKVERITCPNGCSDGACACDIKTWIDLEDENIYSIDNENYKIKLVFVDATSAQFQIVDREGTSQTTNKLTKGSSEKLSDGSTIATTDITYQSFSGGAHQAEFCLNSGEIFTDLNSLADCPQIEKFIKNPTSFELENNKWRLGYNSSWISTYDSRKSYYASFNLVGNSNYEYLSINMQEVDEGFEERLLEELKYSLDWKLCSQRRINEQDVYICLNPWSIASNAGQINDINNEISKTVFWISGNKLFEIYSYNSENYWDCWDQESCEARENYIHRRQQENLIDAFEKLIDNQEKYVGGFYLSWRAEQVVRKLLECKSDLDFGEDVCYSGWRCKTEPVICPPHGTQTQTCIQNCDGEINKVTTEIECSPGICAGCYVPKWFGYQWGNNKCIQYGFRFAQPTGWDYKLVERQEQESLTESEAEREEEVDLKVVSNELAYLTVKDWSNETYTLTPGAEIQVNLPQVEDIKDLVMIVDKIVYIESGDSYIELTFKFKGIERTETKINAYCDIDGKIKQQTTDWQACQNSYECESNLCSGQECTGINAMIKETAQYKVIGIKIICRILHLLSNENYLECQANLLGGQAPEGIEGTPSSGGGGGSGSA